MGGAKDDIDSLRTPWESDDQWNLRSAFLNKHWDSGEFSHDRIVCLSQMFINIEFLGCSYDERVMPVVARLSAGLSDEYRERRRHVVQQTFVPQGSHAPVDPRASRVSHEHRKRTSDLGTRDPNAAEAKRLKKELLAASNESSVEMNRCKAILGIKAELSSGPTGLGPIEQLNAACNRCKLPWRLVDAPPEGGLLRRDVVIDQAPELIGPSPF